MIGLSWEQAAAWRMRRHGLVERSSASELLRTAGRLCGVHAQVMSSAELTLWARLEGLEREAVSRALWEERTLVKTWAMRGTLHLLPAADYPLWQAALSTVDRFFKPAWSRAFGIRPEELERLIEAIGAALDGRELTRAELAEELGDERLSESWGALLKPAAFRGQLIFGRDRGRNVTFTAPPRVDGPPPDEALAEVTRRYLAAYGPATREDFHRWWGDGTPARAGRRIEALGDEVVEVDADGVRAWMLAADAREAAAAAPSGSVRLLPGFDQYVVGSSRRGELFPAAAKKRIYRPQGWISPVLLVDGFMRAVWRHERKGGRLAVTVEPFGPLPDATRGGVEAEAERLAAFLGGEPTVKVA